MGLIQLLLPAGGAPSADGRVPLAETRMELAERFNGLTAYLRSPAKGLWTAPDGHTEQDDVVMVEVVTNTFDRTCAFTLPPSRSAFVRRAFMCEPSRWRQC